MILHQYKNKIMAFISINYDDGNTDNLGYQSVEITYDKETCNRKFDTGDFVKDWFHALKWLITKCENENIVHSTSVNHFIMDGAPYTSVYLMSDKKGNNYFYYGRVREVQEGIEFFVPKGSQPTWDELKNICK